MADEYPGRSVDTAYGACELRMQGLEARILARQLEVQIPPKGHPGVPAKTRNRNSGSLTSTSHRAAAPYEDLVYWDYNWRKAGGS